MDILRKAAEETGKKLVTEETGGEAIRIFSTDGHESVMSTGMDKVHSTGEQISINDMVKAAEFVIAIIRSIS